jgi:hypothetical protein
VIVAVIPMGMMQMSVDQVVDVVAVRYRLVTASWTVHVTRVVPTALVLRRAPIGIGRRHLYAVLVDVVAMHMMQMAVVEVVHVVAMANGCMPAAGTVLVRVIDVLAAFGGAHGWPQGSPVAGRGPAVSSPDQPSGYAIPAQSLQHSAIGQDSQLQAWCPPGKCRSPTTLRRLRDQKRLLTPNRSRRVYNRPRLLIAIL